LRSTPIGFARHGLYRSARDGWAERFGIRWMPAARSRVGPTFMTDVPGIFARGRCKRGASLIVWAIAEGRQMAQ